jgi:hypothetical protein
MVEEPLFGVHRGTAPSDQLTTERAEPDTPTMAASVPPPIPIPNARELAAGPAILAATTAVNAPSTAVRRR